jgi:hypothetical protein
VIEATGDSIAKTTRMIALRRPPVYSPAAKSNAASPHFSLMALEPLAGTGMMIASRFRALPSQN